MATATRPKSKRMVCFKVLKEEYVQKQEYTPNMIEA